LQYGGTLQVCGYKKMEDGITNIKEWWGRKWFG
jgi:hypothetical protein